MKALRTILSLFAVSSPSVFANAYKCAVGVQWQIDNEGNHRVRELGTFSFDYSKQENGTFQLGEGYAFICGLLTPEEAQLAHLQGDIGCALSKKGISPLLGIAMTKLDSPLALGVAVPDEDLPFKAKLVTVFCETNP